MMTNKKNFIKLFITITALCLTSCSTSYKTDKSNVTDTEKTKETILDNSVKENILTEKNYDTDNYHIIYYKNSRNTRSLCCNAP